jgi:hypothetical protein
MVFRRMEARSSRAGGVDVVVVKDVRGGRWPAEKGYIAAAARTQRVEKSGKWLEKGKGGRAGLMGLNADGWKNIRGQAAARWNCALVVSTLKSGRCKKRQF